MLRFEREENGVYKVEYYEEIKASIAIEMLAGFEEVYILDDSDAFVHFDLFADFKEKGVENFGDLLTLKFYKKVEGNYENFNKDNSREFIMLIFINFSIMFAIYGVYAVYVDNYFLAFVSLVLFLISFFLIPFRRS